MCGIAGIFHFDPAAAVSAPVVEKMCAAIRHRGPDDQGVHVHGAVGLGARRLSIIDLNTGHQPIGNEDGSVWVVFNGEIYNFQELRRGLEDRGHRFRTHTDTETIVHLYEEYGADCVQHLRGMFAFALWDERRRQLLLVRDRLGIKPLYYTVEQHRCVFGSELKCLLQAGGISPRVNLDAINHYLSLRYVPEPLTTLENVHKLPAGHLLLVRNGKAKQVCYWELPWEEAEDSAREEEICERIRARVTEAVRLRLVSDVPLGALLSGGVDSSIVVAIMSRLLDRPVQTFSIGFEEQGFSELGYARQVAEHLGTDHHELIVRPEAVGLIERLLAHFDEPFGDSSAIPTFLVSELTRRTVTVALSGDGGDEIFAGYTRYREARRQQVYDLLPGFVRRHMLLPLSRRLGPRAYGKNYLYHISLESGIERYLNAATLPSPVKSQLVTPEFQAQVAGLDVSAALRQHVPNGTQNGLIERLLYLDTKTELPGDILTKVDRMSMAHSLEVRVPLLDHVLVEEVARLPLRYKLRGATSKYILKQAFRDALPETVFHRRKMGFAVPLSDWFRTSLRDFIRDLLFDRRTMARGYFQRPFLENILAEHTDGRRDHSTMLWSLAALEVWHRNYGL